MRTNLPIEILRSFVAVADSGSLSRAALEVFLTQSALSLQMKRLSDLVQAPIFDRHHRGLLLTPDGKTLLAHARAILNLNDQAVSAMAGEHYEGPARVGIIQDFADGPLCDVLIRFSKRHPGADIQIRIGNSSELIAWLAGGVVDLAVCVGCVNDPAAIITPPLLWFGKPEIRDHATVPLVVMEKPCLFRDAATRALEEHGINYRIALETPSVSVLSAAVRAGIGITCRSSAFLHTQLPVLRGLDAPLPQVSVSLHVASKLPKAVDHLAALMRTAIMNLDHAQPQYPFPLRSAG